MLNSLSADKQHLRKRAIVAAFLFTIFLIVVSVLPHQHLRNSSGATTQGTVTLAASSASCSLCDWLSTPHLPAPAPPPVVQIPVLDWQQPTLPAFICFTGFVTLGDSPQRGPPAAPAG